MALLYLFVFLSSDEKFASFDLSCKINMMNVNWYEMGHFSFFPVQIELSNSPAVFNEIV